MSYYAFLLRLAPYWLQHFKLVEVLFEYLLHIEHKNFRQVQWGRRVQIHWWYHSYSHLFKLLITVIMKPINLWLRILIMYQLDIVLMAMKDLFNQEHMARFSNQFSHPPLSPLVIHFVDFHARTVRLDQI